MKKIALVNCFFGMFPWYFPFFIKSCTTNPTVDFLIFTDSDYDGVFPSNVKIIPFTLAQFNELATQKLAFKVAVKKPYKLCDFKPTYGLLFSEYLVEYDFWGITDIDVIYGRIREFMTDELLDEYDLVCVRHDYITACCMLFKNNEYVNTLFKKSKDYKMIFTSQKNYAFDETNFEQSGFLDKYDIFKMNCEIESMQHVILKEELKGNLVSHFDMLLCDGNPGCLKWDNGLFSFKNKLEILLYHLQNYKNNVFANNEMEWDAIPDTFYFDKYNYRKDKSIINRFKVLYDDYLKPFLRFVVKKTDRLLSSILIKSKLKCLAEGEYFYTLTKEKIVIKKDQVGFCYMKFGNSDECILYKMTFNKNYFFAKNLPYIFRLDSDGFKNIASIGYGMIYKKIE
jgi:hypothetical protein